MNCTPARELADNFLSQSRRKFLKSLCRSALVLTFSDVLSLARPLPILGQEAAASADTDLGVTFIDVAKEAGLNAVTIFGGEHKNKYLLETTGCGAAFYDYDNDGWLDIFVANGHIENEIERIQKRVKYAESPHLFHNQGKGKFVEATQSVGPDLGQPRVGRGAAVADIDNDGDLDLLLTTNAGPAILFRNENASGNRSLRMKLVGTKSNRNGIGTVAIVKVGGERQMLMMRSGSGYLSSSELVLTFGLVKAAQADEIELRWPSGQIDKLTKVAAGQTITVKEGAGIVQQRPYGAPLATPAKAVATASKAGR